MSSPHSSPPRPRAVLFDIDGTLLRAAGAGREALARAAAAVFDVPLELSRQRIGAVDFRGATDALILERFGELLGVTMRGSAALATRYLEELAAVLDEVEIEIMPGVPEVIGALGARGDTHLGLLTGNIREGARMKLERARLDHLLDGPGGFGDAGRERADLVRAALAQLADLGVPAAATVIIGDTPIDVSAAQTCGARGVAVATGWTPWDDLAACGADLLVRDLTDPAPLWRLLESL